MTTKPPSPFDRLRAALNPAAQDRPAPALNPDKFRSQAEQGLAESATGRRLLNVAAQQRIAIEIITGKGSSGYIPENRAVFMALPPNLSTARPEDVLTLGAYLRQAELQILGVKNPDESMGKDEKAIAFDTKILDSIVVMCKITSELCERGKTEFLDALTGMGHGDMYRAYQDNGNGDHLVDLYLELYKT